ncbi:MAG: lactate racemase domain-containing protein [Pirellulales bacterium]|nr:lactate racemase domain-containing protein [Pirellulales bacterium]
MPRRELPFGETVIGVELPERTQFVQPGAGGGRLPPAANEAQAVRDALAAPLASDPISARVKPGAKVLIAFDDPTVPSYGPIRRLAIEAVLDELSRAGVDEQNVSLVCANALHRKWTNQELSTGLGDDLIKRFGQRLACHDAEDADNLVHLGVTPEGYDVEVHKLVVDCDLVVYVNAGYYLGFGGGWKSVCVGLSTWRSIRWTHTPDGMSMSLHKNRMHAVFDKMGAFLEQQLGSKVFKIESVLANPFQISRVFAGGVDATRQAAIDLLATVNVPRRSGGEPADVVIYGVPNWSPYATFATMNPILTLISSGLGYLGGHIEARGKQGCSVILATPARDEWDLTHHPAYREVWDNVLTDTLDPVRQAKPGCSCQLKGTDHGTCSFTMKSSGVRQGDRPCEARQRRRCQP